MKLSLIVIYWLSFFFFMSRIPILDFPTCVIGDGPDLSLDNIEIGEFPLCSWRNVYSCINLLRVLNKITKWKHSRIMVQYFKKLYC